MRKIKTKSFITKLRWKDLAFSQKPFFIVSPDKKHIAAIHEDPKGQFVTFDDKKHEVFDEIYDMKFSPNSQRLAYLGKYSTKIDVIVDGHRFGYYDNAIENSLKFSSNSEHVGYAVERGPSKFVVKDGEEHKSYSGILEDNPVFSPDSIHMAYGAYDGDQYYVNLDGDIQGPFERIGKLIFSPDGNRLGFKVKTASKEYLVLDGIRHKEYDHVDNPHFSKDSTRVAHAAKDDGVWMPIIDGVEGDHYDNLVFRDWSSDPANNQFAFLARKNKQDYLMVDGKEMGVGDIYIDSVVFSPEGERLAYALAVKKKKKFGISWGKDTIMVIDGNPGETYSKVTTGVFSPNGDRFAYIAKRDKDWYLVVDGNEIGPYKVISGEESPFSPDGLHLAIEVRKESGYFVVRDGVEMGPYGGIGKIVFSPDSDHLAFDAIVDNRQTVVVDGDNGKFFDAVVSVGGGKVVFTAPNEFYYMGVEGENYFLVEEVIE